MPKRTRALGLSFALALCATLTATAADTIHRWVDTDGRVHYGDRPPPEQIDQTRPRPTAKTAARPAQPAPVARAQPTRQPAASPAEAAPHVVAELRHLLTRRDFAGLEARMAALEADFARDYGAEDRLFKTLDAFDQWGDAQKGPLDAWVAASPDHYQPYLARAAYWVEQGWDTRGRNWATKTSDAQIAGMKRCFARASQDLETAARLNPRSILPHYLRIRIAVAVADLPETSASLRRALAISPASYRVRNAYLNGLKPRWHGSHREMRQYVAESQHYVAQNPRLSHLEAEVLVDEASIAWNDKRLAEADGLYTRALAIGEEHRILGARAYVRPGLGRLHEALADIDRAIAMDGEYPVHYVSRSRILSKMDRYPAALAAIEQAYALDPLDPDVRERFHRVTLVLGYQAHEREKPATALTYFDRAIELVDTNADAYYRRSRALAELKRDEDSLRDVRRSIELDPDQIRFYRMIDWLLLKQRDYDQIIGYWGRFIARHPDSDAAYLERAGTHYHKGDFESARQDARKAVELGSIDAQGLLQRLSGTN
ncbi:MAG: DUF4034 domain-containing protein [Rhodocyclaceae bacterium]|nr:DUF4034 domain-containing protein [Rhodocyclaceae bacterium]